MDLTLAEKVRNFVAEEVGVPRFRLLDDTTLFGDLKLDGDDAEELMLAFAQEFKVNLDEFDFSKHFGPEGFGPWRAVMDLFRVGTPESKSGVQPITVGTLIKSASSGRWTSPAAV